MKVFISGSKNLNKSGNDGCLPDGVRKYLDCIMSEGTDILIGDCYGTDAVVQEYINNAEYKKVTVYSSGSHHKIRNNVGHWEEKYFPVTGRTPYSLRVEKDFYMIEDCDYGIALWDGNSKGTFINVLCLCALKKPCRLYFLQYDRWWDVESLQKLRGLTGPEGEITTKEIRDALTACAFSKEMTRYLVSEKAISPYQLIDIISRAPISLDEKNFLFISLGKKRNIKFEAFASVNKNIKLGNDFKNIKDDIKAIVDFRGERTIWTELYDRCRALSEAKDFIDVDSNHNHTLFLFSEWYDIDELQLKTSAVGMFTTTGVIESYIQNEDADNDTGDGYYRVEVWDNKDVYWENIRYDYYYNQEKLCWFEKLKPEKQEHKNTYYMTENREFAKGSFDLNFGTPYKPGDIVLIDCRPFGPPFHAMILEARQQWDCCFPNIIFQYQETNEWCLTPLKHRQLYKDIGRHTYAPLLSPLYRLRKVRDEELTTDDSKLLELSSIISGSEEKASKVWNNWCSPSEDNHLSWAQVLEIFAYIR